MALNNDEKMHLRSAVLALVSGAGTLRERLQAALWEIGPLSYMTQDEADYLEVLGCASRPISELSDEAAREWAEAIFRGYERAFCDAFNRGQRSCAPKTIHTITVRKNDDD
jgi:hypothetical protein